MYADLFTPIIGRMAKQTDLFNPRYLKAVVFGANDGIVTTFAVVAGVAGAGLAPSVIIILGIANMVADGISMAVGDFLGERSEWQLEHQRNGTRIPTRLWMSGLLTFGAFVTAGSLPLMPYFLRLVGVPVPLEHQFGLSIAATALTLFFVGSLRSVILHRVWWKNGLEMLGVGSIAAAAAYVLGVLIEQAVR